MSIGKSSIARAVNATATKTQTNESKNISINKFSLDNIGLLQIAKPCADITALKASITKRGIICPVLVAVTSKDEVWLIDGYSRVAAAKELDIKEIDAVVIKVDTKRDANNLYNEFNKSKSQVATDDIHEEKFRVLCVKDHDLPAYLL